MTEVWYFLRSRCAVPPDDSLPQKSHGEMSLRPVASKSGTFRVAKCPLEARNGRDHSISVFARAAFRLGHVLPPTCAVDGMLLHSSTCVRGSITPSRPSHISRLDDSLANRCQAMGPGRLCRILLRP